MAQMPLSPLLQIKLLSQAERSLELLDADESKYADDMVAQQEDFVSKVNNLATVRCRNAAEVGPSGLPLFV